MNILSSIVIALVVGFIIYVIAKQGNEIEKLKDELEDIKQKISN